VSSAVVMFPSGIDLLLTNAHDQLARAVQLLDMFANVDSARDAGAITLALMGVESTLQQRRNRIAALKHEAPR